MDAGSLSFEQKKNAYLLHLLSDLRSSDTAKMRSIESSSNQSDEQLERTYKKALSDYSSVSQQLERQTSHCSKQSTELRDRLREKEDKADSITETLQKYRRDIAQQSSYVNSKPFDMDQFEQLTTTSQALDEDVERERLKNTSLKVEIAQLEQKIKKKNALAGGISHIEFHHLANDIKKSDDKLKHCDVELQRNTSSKRHMLSMESKLQDEIRSYLDRNKIAEERFKELDNEIEKKRGHLSRLESTAKETKKKIGFDSADIGAYLKTRVINDDFGASKDEIDRLHVKLNELTSLYSTLIKSPN
jgi:chromosome segregation ATPase